MRAHGEMSEEREKSTEMDDLVAKRSASSIIWKYFGYRKDDVDQKQVLCRECRAVVATTRGNTTNSFDHLSRHHRALYDECKARSDCRPKQKTISDAFASVTP